MPASEPDPLEVFVGREQELDALVRGLEGALGSEAALALVVGEAGIGKSRLVDALVAEAGRREVRVVQGEASGRQSAPLSLWAGVERALGLRADHLDPPLPASEGRWALLDALAAGLAEAAPVLVLLEDLHWADEASLWVLERLPRELVGQRVMVVGTSRREEPGAAELEAVRSRAAVLELGGLDVEAVERLVQARGIGLAAEEVDPVELVARTGGNPLFVRELLALKSRGDRLPPVVSGILVRLLARLDSPTQDALAALAVAGPDTPLVVLTAALDVTVEEALVRFETAAASDVVLLGPAGRPEFRHVLLAEAAASTITPARRRSLHTALAEAWRVLDSSPSGRARSAWHSLAALPDGDPALAGSESLDAVSDLRKVGDDVAAAELAAIADQALEACGGILVELRARIEVELAQSLDALGEPARAQEVYALAADLLLQVDQPELRAAAEVGACQLANPLQPDPERVRRLAEVEAALTPRDHPLRVGLLGRLAVLRCATPDGLEAAHADGDAAVELARRLDDPDLLVTALADRHFVPLGLEGLEARALAADELVMLGERLRRPDIALQGFEWQYADRLSCGDLRGANAALDTLEAYAQVMPSPRWRWSAVVRRAALHQIDGDRESALARADEAAGLGVELSAPEPEALGLEFGIRATTALLWGVPDPGLRTIYERLAVATAPAAGGPFIGILMARGACAIGEPDRARPAVARWAANPEQLLRGLEGTHLVAIVANLAAELRLYDHAASLRQVLAPFQDRLGSGIGIQPVTPVSTTLGRLALLEGDAKTAVAHHERGLALVAAMPSPTLVAHCAAYLAEARAAAGDRAGAVAALAEARQAAQPLGIVLPDLGVVPAPSSAAPPGRAVLKRGADGWTVTSPHGAGTVPHSLGLAQLARLLAAPLGTEVLATELAGMEASPVPVARDLGAALDSRAKREYRRRIGELQADIDEAEADNDPERAALARRELDALIGELRRAVGLDGRDRPTGSGAERARVNVTRSLRRAIAAVGTQIPDLGAHLELSVCTGRYCSYSPEPSAALVWEVVEGS